LQVLDDFRHRARLYANWDARLAAKTRFFGAAAVTNAALVELFSVRGERICLSGRTSEFLSKVGRALEIANIEMGHRIMGAIRVQGDLDAEMVAAEQARVEQMLRLLECADPPGYAATVAQMNRLLSFLSSTVAVPKWFSNGATYGRVLRIVTEHLARSPTFARQSDRERIGQTLIRQLRGGS
jgi:hypothetical protein